MDREADWIHAWCLFGALERWSVPDFLRLLRETGGPEEAASAPYATLLKILGPEGADAVRAVEVEAVAEATAAWLERCSDAFIWTILDEDFPARFFRAGWSPLCLFGRGERSLLSNKLLMIAGDGEEEEARFNTESLAKAAVEKGYVLSLPCRSTLEKASLRAIISNPSASAVVWTPGTPDRVSGTADRAYYATLLQRGGAFIGFRPPGYSGPLPEEELFYFQVAAGSDALLVPAARRMSAVCRVAGEMTRMGRDVFAVPGSIHAPSSKGPHSLLRQGATLVESVRDIAEAFPPH